MNLSSLLNIRRPVLFETALCGATGAQLRALHEESAGLDHHRLASLEAEIARRRATRIVAWYVLIIALLIVGGTFIYLDHVIAES